MKSNPPAGATRSTSPLKPSNRSARPERREAGASGEAAPLPLVSQERAASPHHPSQRGRTSSGGIGTRGTPPGKAAEKAAASSSTAEARSSSESSASDDLPVDLQAILDGAVKTLVGHFARTFYGKDPAPAANGATAAGLEKKIKACKTSIKKAQDDFHAKAIERHGARGEAEILRYEAVFKEKLDTVTEMLEADKKLCGLLDGIEKTTRTHSTLGLAMSEKKEFSNEDMGRLLQLGKAADRAVKEFAQAFESAKRLHGSHGLSDQAFCRLLRQEGDHASIKLCMSSRIVHGETFERLHQRWRAGADLLWDAPSAENTDFLMGEFKTCKADIASTLQRMMALQEQLVASLASRHTLHRQAGTGAEVDMLFEDTTRRLKQTGNEVLLEAMLKNVRMDALMLDLYTRQNATPRHKTFNKLHEFFVQFVDDIADFANVFLSPENQERDPDRKVAPLTLEGCLQARRATAHLKDEMRGLSRSIRKSTGEDDATRGELLAILDGMRDSLGFAVMAQDELIAEVRREVSATPPVAEDSAMLHDYIAKKFKTFTKGEVKPLSVKAGAGVDAASRASTGSADWIGRIEKDFSQNRCEQWKAQADASIEAAREATQLAREDAKKDSVDDLAPEAEINELFNAAHAELVALRDRLEGSRREAAALAPVTGHRDGLDAAQLQALDRLLGAQSSLDEVLQAIDTQLAVQSLIGNARKTRQFLERDELQDEVVCDLIDAGVIDCRQDDPARYPVEISGDHGAEYQLTLTLTPELCEAMGYSVQDAVDLYPGNTRRVGQGQVEMRFLGHGHYAEETGGLPTAFSVKPETKRFARGPRAERLWLMFPETARALVDRMDQAVAKRSAALAMAEEPAKP